jgi:ABC-type amino acid transport system permease subunit
MEPLMFISAVVGLANIGILTALLVIYVKVYRNTKAVFTIGLIFFVGLLMLHNTIAVYAYFAMEQLYAIRLLPYFVGIHIAELAGLSVLFRLSLL